MADATQPERRRAAWPLLRSFAGWRWADLAGDAAAGLTLAAIAVPEQMATARLGGFPPEAGLFAFVAASAAFALLGANRYLSSGADSTITPIFAGTLALVAAQGSPAYLGLAAALALMVGAVLVLAGLARLGWIAGFLSVPVTTGFLAGIALHILASQLPALLGLDLPQAAPLPRLAAAIGHLGESHLLDLMLGGIVFAAMVAGETVKPRLPGAILGLALAMGLVAAFGLEGRGVAVVGAQPLAWPHPGLPALTAQGWGRLAALALVVAAIVMVQTAATTRAFASLAEPQDVDRDFVGVGAGSIAAGLFGLFPVNASPPRTAAVEQAGGRSQLAGLVATFVVLALVAFAAPLLRFLPLAALAGVLLAIALRIARPSTVAQVMRQTRAEFALILGTTLAIVILPIQSGVAVGIGLSVLHGLWTITRTRIIEFEKVPGTSVWWPPSAEIKGETLPQVRVLAFQAPLSFLNADEFRLGMIETIERDAVSLIVFEASSVAEIDFTAAQVLLEVIARCNKAGIGFAIARLTSLRAQQALVRFGITKALGEGGIYRSVDDAIKSLAPSPPSVT